MLVSRNMKPKLETRFSRAEIRFVRVVTFEDEVDTFNLLLSGSVTFHFPRFLSSLLL